MLSFAAKAKTGRYVLGLALSEEDIAALKRGERIEFDLESVNVGLWRKEADGSRTFQQPRDSNVVVIPGDNAADVGEFLGVTLPEDISTLQKQAK